MLLGKPEGLPVKQLAEQTGLDAGNTYIQKLRMISEEQKIRNVAVDGNKLTLVITWPGLATVKLS